MNCEITLYPLSIFEQILSLHKNGTSEIYEDIIEKYNDLKTRYDCFNTMFNGHGNGHGHGHGHGYGHGHGGYGGNGGHCCGHGGGAGGAGFINGRMRKGLERPKVGNRDFSKLEMMKKELLSNLNKISPMNVAAIMKNIQTIYHFEYQEAFLDIIIDFMIRQPDYQPLFVSIIRHIQVMASQHSEEILLQLNAYIEKKLDVIMSSSFWNTFNCDTEDFTERVKCKARISSTTKCVIEFSQKHTGLILPDRLHTMPEDLLAEFVKDFDDRVQRENEGKDDALYYEILLEQLQIFIQPKFAHCLSLGNHTHMRNKVLQWEEKVNLLPYSIIRYKFLDIKDLLFK